VSSSNQSRIIVNLDGSLLDGLSRLPQELLDKIYGLLVLPDHEGRLPTTLWLQIGHYDHHLISPKNGTSSANNLLLTPDEWTERDYDQFCHIKGFGEALYRMQEAGNDDSKPAATVLRNFLCFLGDRIVLQTTTLERTYGKLYLSRQELVSSTL